MTHNGFIGSVNYSDEDEIFYGKLEFINDLVTFEGASAKELKQSFIDAVNGYIDFCKEVGKEPQKPFKGVFNVRVKPELHQQAALVAAKKGIALNQVVAEALSQYVASH